MNLLDEIKRARGVGVPLIAVATADQPATIKAIHVGLKRHEGACTEENKCNCQPRFRWDVVRGMIALNVSAARAKLELDLQDDATKNPIEALDKALKLPKRSILIMMSANRLMVDFEPMQAILNLRDEFKGNGRTLIMTGPDFRLPAELTQDVLMLDDALPDDSAIEAILGPLYSSAKIECAADDLERSKSALRGLAPFPVEQAAALSVDLDKDGKPTGVDVKVMWQRKKTSIAQVRGMTMETSTITYADIEGVDQAKKYFKRLFAGKRKPRVIVWLEEIEKAVAGAGGDGRGGESSGTSQDAMAVMLTVMQERKIPGALFLGPGGSGKSEFVKATAGEFNVPILSVDLGACKGRYVGDSETMIRALWKAVIAIAGEDGAIVMATCNGIETLGAPLRRRLGRRGMWMVDIPSSAKEREAIAKIHIAKYGVKDKKAIEFFRSAEGWSGANIHDACEQADSLGMTIAEAAEFVVPAKEQDQGLERLRQLAHGKFLSASQPGKYQAVGGNIPNAEPKIRRIGVIADIEEPENGPEDKSKLN